jgi:hypothetical protein
VRYASISDGLASCMRATGAEHTVHVEDLCGVGIKINNSADDGIFGYKHFILPRVFFVVKTVYHKAIKKSTHIFDFSIYIFRNLCYYIVDKW